MILPLQMSNTGCFYPAIPYAFDDSLSYYEELSKILSKLNEVIKELNTISAGDAYVDKQIAELRKYTDNQIAYTSKSDRGYTDTKVSQLATELAKNTSFLLQTVKNADTATRNIVLWELERFKNEIRNIPLPSIYNPITGKYQSVQDCFNSMYEYLRTQALSAYEFDNLLYTAQEFDNLNISALDFDLYSKTLMEKPIKMISPFTGLHDSYENIINQLADLHKIGISAQDFDNKQWSAETYDSKQITAYDFDWKTVA